MSFMDPGNTALDASQRGFFMHNAIGTLFVSGPSDAAAAFEMSFLQPLGHLIRYPRFSLSQNAFAKLYGRQLGDG
jgi:hypothetical protein